jgi:uncharacterized protein YecE (DUF72 family)
VSGHAAGRARVGCSGWVYPDWRGVVYPADAPNSSWFASYAARFDTVELNRTFYRLPQASTVERWERQAPESFCYAVKVGQFGSHRKKLRDAERWLARHLERIECLGDHLGPNLLQLPPHWKRNVSRLDGFFAAAPRRVRWAVEVRDPSWLHDDVFDLLAHHGAALCIHHLVDDHPWQLTTSWTYLRFHGPAAAAHAYHGRYGRRRLRPIADRLTAWLDDGVDLYAYFNNDYEGHAVEDATTLRRLLGG